MVQRPWLRSLPPVLVIQLKRFEYSSQANDFIKLMGSIAFPLRDLDMAPYLHPTAAQAVVDGRARFDQACAELSTATAAAQAAATPSAAAFSAAAPIHSAASVAFAPLTPGRHMAVGAKGHTSAAAAPWHALISAPSNGKYDLFAVVCHVGTVERGHYTAYARYTDSTTSVSAPSEPVAAAEGAGKGPSISTSTAPASPGWHYFDDVNVTPAREEDVCSEAVSKLAYLLFYVKQTPESVEAAKRMLAQIVPSAAVMSAAGGPSSQQAPKAAAAGTKLPPGVPAEDAEAGRDAVLGASAMGMASAMSGLGIA
jgi:hypothetical protein